MSKSGYYLHEYIFVVMVPGRRVLLLRFHSVPALTRVDLIISFTHGGPVSTILNFPEEPCKNINGTKIKIG